MEEEHHTNEFTGVWLPAHVLDHESLTTTDKIVWAQITALYNSKKGGCFASNKYLGEKVKKGEKQISTIIAKLISLNLVEHVSFDGRKRVIRSLYDKHGRRIEN